MPSVINTSNNHFSSVPSELDLLSDSAVSTTASSLRSNKNDNSSTIQELKDRERRRRQWLEPEDEFSVPIHTESPLITKSPLEMSSFLLNYRAMRRSVEIMTPPSTSNASSKNHDGLSSTPLHPTLPDGPIYIHHRSTLAEGPLSSVISSCVHLQCFDHTLGIPSSKGPDCRMNRVLSNSAQQSAGAGGALTKDNQDRYYSYSQDTTSLSPRSTKSRDNDTSSGEHSFLESHIASISQWLTSNTV
ncbi:hypothetical protein BG015_007942 [Linnemannia schmuckeri]|uniref:Uncharacterized protein n=1 Tax=Linnemannia schmuckeri TaxID=64567 RepID=A0A9P5RXQ0_9FUNG|nr:hypothetical protein BG015_007942 [Linnemannia schmuckeri]